MIMSELCRGELVQILEGESLQAAAQLMDERSVGCLVVMDRTIESKPIGIITDRDIVIKAAANNLDMRQAKVESLLASLPISVELNTSAEDALKLMEERRIRRILVVDSHGKALGLVSMDDLICVIADQLMGIARLISVQIGTSARHRSHEFTRMA
jgi:CBS domain-containing protein